MRHGLGCASVNAAQEVERQGHNGEKSEKRGDRPTAHRLER